MATQDFGSGPYATMRRAMDRLRAQRAPMEDAWKRVTRYMYPEADSWSETEPASQCSPALSEEVYDTTALCDADLMCRGLSGYNFGASRNWLQLDLEGEEASGEAAKWLQGVARRMSRRLSGSNFYQSADIIFRSGVCLGTAIWTFARDDATGMTMYEPKHLKDCLIMQGPSGEIDTLFSAFWLDADDAARYFGDDCPEEARRETDRTRQRKYWRVCCPDCRFGLPTEDAERPWFCAEFADDGKGFIRTWRQTGKGFAAWRWMRAPGGGPWGVGSPGMQTVNQAMLLSGMMREYCALIQKAANPMVKKTRGLEIRVAPGAQIPLDSGQDFAFVGPTGSLAPQFEEMARMREDVDAAFFKTFFFALLQSLDKTRTATEVQAIQDEQSYMMTSFLSNLQNEVLEPVCEWEFRMMQEDGELDTPDNPMPDGLAGADVRIDYISPFATIQKRQSRLVGTRATINEAVQLAQVDQRLLEKVRLGKYLDEFALLSNCDLGVLVDESEYEDRMAAMDQQEAQQRQLENSLASMEAMGKAYKESGKAAEQGSLAATLAGQMGLGGSGGSNGQG